MTREEIDAAVDAILAQEGRRFQPGNVAAGDPCDKYGITPAALGAWQRLGRPATAAEVAALTESAARRFYEEVHIVAPRFAEIVHPRVRSFTIDFGVNSGIERAAWYLQKAAGVAPDMAIGPVTLAAVEAADPDLLLMRLVRARVEMLVRWVRARPAARGPYAAVIARAVGFLPGLGA